jgi:hypothetical protein
MSDVLSSAELHGCPVELLPARTVLSLFAAQGGGGLLGGLGGLGGGSGSGSGGGGGGGGGGLLKMIPFFGAMFGGQSHNGANGTANDGGTGATNG